LSSIYLKANIARWLTKTLKECFAIIITFPAFAGMTFLKGYDDSRQIITMENFFPAYSARDTNNQNKKRENP